MPENALSINRLAWLSAALGQKRSRIMELMQRMAHFGLPNALKPLLLGRFQHLLEQLNEERSEEMMILNRIEAMEQKHHWRRQNNLLEHANSNHKPDEHAEPEQHSNGLWERVTARINAFCIFEK